MLNSVDLREFHAFFLHFLLYDVFFLNLWYIYYFLIHLNFREIDNIYIK